MGLCRGVKKFALQLVLSCPQELHTCISNRRVQEVQERERTALCKEVGMFVQLIGQTCCE